MVVCMGGSMTINFPSTKSIKDAIRSSIAREVTFVTVGSYTACPVCSGLDQYDGVNDCSLNPFCGFCSGKYWVITNNNITVSGHVRWYNQDTKNYSDVGYTLAGDCLITIDINDLTADQISSIRNVVVDNRKLEVYKTVYKGVPTSDRISFTCREYEKS